jgi:hypothetical protein
MNSHSMNRQERLPEIPPPQTVPDSLVPDAAPPEGDAWIKSQTTDPTRFGDWEKRGRCIDF